MYCDETDEMETTMILTQKRTIQKICFVETKIHPKFQGDHSAPRIRKQDNTNSPITNKPGIKSNKSKDQDPTKTCSYIQQNQ